jgi:hypothetical protein
LPPELKCWNAIHEGLGEYVMDVMKDLWQEEN